MPSRFQDEMPSGHVPKVELSPYSSERRRQAEQALVELRRKVQDSELLSRSIEQLLLRLNFNGRLTVVVQNGRVLKSGYEEGYFHRKDDDRPWT